MGVVKESPYSLRKKGTADMNKELIELIRSIVNKCVDERTSIDNDEASLVEEENGKN